jgi:hypothetical protein
MAEIVGHIPNLYREDPENAANMILAQEYMHREYEIREADKKTWFLAGVSRSGCFLVFGLGSLGGPLLLRSVEVLKLQLFVSYSY